MLHIVPTVGVLSSESPSLFSLQSWERLAVWKLAAQTCCTGSPPVLGKVQDMFFVFLFFFKSLCLDSVIGWCKIFNTPFAVT